MFKYICQAQKPEENTQGYEQKKQIKCIIQSQSNVRDTRPVRNRH